MVFLKSIYLYLSFLKKHIHIVGGGPAALMLASELDSKKFDISVFERNSTLGRKFLVAGQGGFNLTHSEDPDAFIKRYTPSHFLKPAFFSFNNINLINWLKEQGIPTYVGTSGRVFPEKRN